MSLQSGFFDSTEVVESESGILCGNKAKDAAFFARYFASFVGSGVFMRPANSFSVLAQSGLTVQIRPGAAFLCGYFAFDDEPATHTFQTDSAAHTYSLVLRLDKTDWNISFVWVTDPASGSLPLRNDSFFDLLIASVTVGAGVMSLTDEAITDHRFDSSVCGFVKSLVDELGIAECAYAERAGSLTGILPLTGGGTGASTAEGARDALGLGGAALLEAGSPLGTATLDAGGKVTPTQTNSAVVSVTGSKTLALSDAGTMLLVNSSSSVTLTVSSSVAFPIGTELEICRFGSGNVTIAVSGCSLNGASTSKTIPDRYTCAALKLVASGSWLLTGNIE